MLAPMSKLEFLDNPDCYNREIAMSFGRPIITTLEEADVPLPEAIDDDRLSDNASQPNVQPRDQPSWMQSFTEKVKLYNILERVLKRADFSSRLTSDGRPDFQAILSLDTMIAKWRGSLPAHLRCDEKGNYAPAESTLCKNSESVDACPAKSLFTRCLTSDC